jgi:hypothetical protein
MTDIVDIDNILEDDLIEALGDMGNSSNVPLVNKTIDKTTEKSVVNINNIDDTNIDEIAKLLKELLNNKTIEISIKIQAN